MRSAFRRCGSLLGPAFLHVCLLVLTDGSVRAEGWPRVAVTEPAARASVHAALDGALEWWSSSHCRTLLTDFHDEQGCPLSEKLVALRTTFDAYLKWVSVHDASGTEMCKNPNQFAFTKTGSRVVFVCGKSFRRLFEREQDRATAVMIHEALHTLGLGENGSSPTSREITRIVLDRCGAAEPRDPPPTIFLFLINEAGVPQAVLASAQAEATRIYEAIGVKLVWSDDVATNHHFVLKLIAEPPAGASVDRRAMGGAPGTKHARGTLAYAYYRRVERLAHNSETDVAQILGPVMAHELGHLLLPHGSDSVVGVMSYGWDHTQLERARKSQIRFTAAEAKAILEKLKRQPNGSQKDR